MTYLLFHLYGEISIGMLSRGFLGWQRVASFLGPECRLFFRFVGLWGVPFISVPMSVDRYVMLGSTLLPRTFAEYACCRFVEIR